MASVSRTGSGADRPGSSSADSINNLPGFQHDLEPDCQEAFELDSLRTTSSRRQLLCSDDTWESDTNVPKTATTDTSLDDISVKPTLAQRLKDLWIWESLSVSLSAACIIAMAAVLGSVNGKSLSYWTIPIRPNALISIFAAVAKSALLLPLTECISQSKWLYFSEHHRRLQDLQAFDDASRGPFGSFLFLGRMHRKAWLASLACFVIIAGMAVDPFAQQIIDYPHRPVASGDPIDAVTRVTQAYDTGLDNDPGNLLAIYVDSEMQSAVLGGALDRPLDPPFRCFNGNCIWPELITLGVCSACLNITGIVNETCVHHASRGQGEDWWSGAKCRLTAPSGLFVQQEIWQNHTKDETMDRWTQFMSANSRPMTTIRTDIPPLENVSAKDVVGSGDISRHFFVRDVGDLDLDGIFQPSRQYTECTLYWCSRNYANFSVMQGIAEVGSVTDTPLKVEDIPSVRLVSGEKSTVSLTAPTTFSGDGHFYANLADMASTSDLIHQVFADVELFNLHTMAYTSSACLRLDNSLVTAVNLSKTMAHVAESVTSAIRWCDNATEVSGQAVGDETYMRVRWAWFALPASLVLLTAAILVAAVRINSRNKVMLWKSSMLPLLFHGLDATVEAPPRQKLSQVDARARKARARLHVTENNDLRFVPS